jgi:carbonic anhydrase
MKKKYGVDYVDSVTEAGPDGILSSSSPIAESIQKRVSISINKHGSRAIAVVGHDDCAGNPVSKDTHLKNICDSVKLVSAWFKGVDVIGLWVDENWVVHEVK